MDSFEVMKEMRNLDEVQKKFCTNCGAEINVDDDKCSRCGCKLGEIKEKEENYKLNSIKNFILKYGRILFDIDTCIWFVFTGLITLFLLLAFIGSFLPNEDGYFENISAAPWIIVLAIIIPIIILVAIILIKYFVYLLIDIKDTLKNIKSNLKNKD